MIALRPEEEKIINGVIAGFAPDCGVYAYGSRVRGTHRKTSDLDLAFALPSGAKLPPARLGEIKYAFSESDLEFRVDISDYNSLEPHFREIIDSERVDFDPNCPLDADTGGGKPRPYDFLIDL